FMRAHAWPNRNASDSIPFMRITRTRVKASSLSLWYGVCTISRQVKCCWSRGMPVSRRRLIATTYSVSRTASGIRRIARYIERALWRYGLVVASCNGLATNTQFWRCARRADTVDGTPDPGIERDLNFRTVRSTIGAIATTADADAISCLSPAGRRLA